MFLEIVKAKMGLLSCFPTVKEPIAEEMKESCLEGNMLQRGGEEVAGGLFGRLLDWALLSTFEHF